MSISAPSRAKLGTSMSLSPTTSGTEPALIAVASWLVSSLGGVRCSTILRFLWVALKAATSAFAGPSVACRAQKCTTPVALTPNVLVGGADEDDELQADRASASMAAPAMTPRWPSCREWASLIAIRLSHVVGGRVNACEQPPWWALGLGIGVDGHPDPHGPAVAVV